MITDARVLDPEFVPDDVVHRDGEINHLTSTLRPITDGETAEPAFLYGPSGTGKTCIAQYALDSLREAVIALNTQYVNCWEDYSWYKTLYRILEGSTRPSTSTASPPQPTSLSSDCATMTAHHTSSSWTKSINFTTKTLEKLTTHQTILYDIITDHGEITPSELYTQYQEQASNPRSKRMVRNYLTKLIHYNLIETDGENRGRTYRPVTNNYQSPIDTQTRWTLVTNPLL